jgi:hypothetical protein
MIIFYGILLDALCFNEIDSKTNFASPDITDSKGTWSLFLFMGGLQNG